MTGRSGGALRSDVGESDGWSAAQGDDRSSGAPRLRTVTLGCKVNQYETELVREGLRRAGFRDAADGEPAEVCVVNTCTVTAEGDAKSRQVIRRLARENPRARLMVMGCYATRAPHEVARLPGVAEVITDKRELPDWLARIGVSDVPEGISSFGHHQRAFVKVQDGCLLRCSYCIIPMVRPRMVSRQVEDITAEVARLVANGYREIVLTGIHLGHYGVDLNQGRPRDRWCRLATLVDRLCRLPGEFRLRLSSIEATEVTRQLLAAMARHSDRVCPHLHVCLQSGSDRILRAMRRRWGVQRFVDRCELARQYLDHPALTTDVIVGFPGETDADFEATLDVCRELSFSKIHIFPFSARRGTPAADFSHQVPAALKSERVQRLASLERRTRQDYLQSLLGRPLSVLIEGVVEPGSVPDHPEPQDGGQGTHVLGTACRYVTVQLSGPAELLGQIRQVTPRRLLADGQSPPRLLAD